jgi:hypothetical protein
MNFHLVKAGDRPLLAISQVPTDLVAAGADCYPGHTWKKRAIRSAVRVAARTGLLQRLFPSVKLPLRGIPEPAFHDWLESLEAALGHPKLHPVLVWPGDPNRGRIYIYFLGCDGRKLAFCKLGLDERNSRLIEREHDALLRLQQLKLERTQIPKVMANGVLGGSSYLVVATTPAEARVTDWSRDASIESNIAEFAGKPRLISRAEAEQLSWWPDIRSRFGMDTRFGQAIDRAAMTGIEVCRAHGDLNQTNVLRHGGEVWLLDWEQSCENAPCLTDAICVAVDSLVSMQPSDPAGNLKKFKREFLELRNDSTEEKVVLGLAYLGCANFTPALSIIREWFGE